MTSPRPREVDDYHSAEEMDPEPSAFRASQEMSQNMLGSSSSADTGLAPYFRRPIVIPAGLEPLPSLRIPLPTFDGQTDPNRHLTQFLDACLENGVRNPHHLMQLFPTSLHGDAYDWYVGLELGSITTWSQLGRSFHDGFALAGQSEHALSKLLNCKQQSQETIRAYVTHFRNVRNRYHSLVGDGILLACFTKGLNSEAHLAIHRLKPVSYQQVIAMALDYENDVKIVSRGAGPSTLSSQLPELVSNLTLGQGSSSRATSRAHGIFATEIARMPDHHNTPVRPPVNRS
eukprot:Gb_31311 [translate_table: standard]